jgi:hypothetical protein
MEHEEKIRVGREPFLGRAKVARQISASLTRALDKNR